MNRWVHLGVVKDLKKVSFYIDGSHVNDGYLKIEEITYDNDSRYIAYPKNDDFRKGKHEFLDRNDNTISLDELRFYDVSLSAEEIRTISQYCKKELKK